MSKISSDPQLPETQFLITPQGAQGPAFFQPENSAIWVAEKKISEALVGLLNLPSETFLNSLRSQLGEAELLSSFKTLLSQTSLLSLITEAGVPGDRGFLADLGHALSHRLFPKSVYDTDLDGVLERLVTVFNTKQSAFQVSAEVWQQALTILDAALKDTDHFVYWKQDVLDGIELLSCQIAAVGHSPSLRSYFNKNRSLDTRRRFERSHFTLFRKSVQGFLDSKDYSLANAQVIFAEIQSCLDLLENMTALMEESGVSVDVVFRVQQLKSSLVRVKELLNLLCNDSNGFLAWFKFFLVLLEKKKQDLDPFFISTIHLTLLAKKITEHAGASGEHYITTNTKEYKAMWWSACGAGVFTILTCFLKVKIVGSVFPPLVEGALMSLNYALSFLFLQHLGLSLATKQGSMTAAFLAQRMDNRRSFLSLISRIGRSQFIAAAGNVCAVIPAAIVLELVYRMSTGVSLMNEHKAQLTFEAFDVFSPSLYLLGVLTGAILWLSSLVSGWIENFAIYHRLSFVLQTKILNLSGTFPSLVQKAAPLARFFGTHIRGWGGNVSLGIFLAIPSLLGRLLGLSIDVRHVTLGAGVVTLAIASSLFPMGAVPSLQLFQSNHFGLAVRALAGVFVVGILNVFTSFLLSLVLATTARNQHPRKVLALLRSVGKDFVAGPWQYFFPPGVVK